MANVVRERQKDESCKIAIVIIKLKTVNLTDTLSMAVHHTILH